MYGKRIDDAMEVIQELSAEALSLRDILRKVFVNAPCFGLSDLTVLEVQDGWRESLTLRELDTIRRVLRSDD